MKIKYYLYLAIHLIGISTFGQRTVGLLMNSNQAYEGYTLFGPSGSRNTYLIDNCGYEVHRWNTQYLPGQVSYLLADGNLLRTARIGGAFNGGGIGGRVEIISWEGNVIWGYNFATDTTHQHHVAQMLPNGNILVVLWHSYTKQEAVSQGFIPSVVPTNGIWSDKIIEVKPIGTNQIELIWEWDFWDHTIQDYDATKANYGVVSDHPELLDVNFYEDPGANRTEWIHLNAIDYNPELDQIIVNSKYHNEYYIIDHSTTLEEAKGHTGGKYGRGGDFLYRWGNPRSYQRGTTANHWLFGQHDVQWIPKGIPGEGNVLLFNNGSNRIGGVYSSVEEFKTSVQIDGKYAIDEGKAFQPEMPSWYYQGEPRSSFYSSRISSAQRLPNGNTLICEGNKGNFIEVSNNGDIVWNYKNPINNLGSTQQGTTPNNIDVFKITRYPSDYSGLVGKDLSPKQILEIDSTPYDCSLLTGVKNANVLDIRLVENPIYDYIYLTNTNGQKLNYRLINTIGQNFKDGILSSSISIFNIPSGMYYLLVFDNDNQYIQTIKIQKI